MTLAMVCMRCKCLRTDYTRSLTRCDRCTDPLERRAQHNAVMADPEKHERVKAQKRALRAKAKAERLAAEPVRKWRTVSVPETNDADITTVPLELAYKVNRAVTLYFDEGSSETEVGARMGITAGYAHVLIALSEKMRRTRKQATSAAMRKWHARRAHRLTKDEISLFSSEDQT